MQRPTPKDTTARWFSTEFCESVGLAESSPSRRKAPQTRESLRLFGAPVIIRRGAGSMEPGVFRLFTPCFRASCDSDSIAARSEVGSACSVPSFRR